jgi:small subunit ribosomal protein S6
MPSPIITRPYEAVYILDPDSGEEQVAAITARYRSLVETQGGQVQKVEVWERRKLAYEVKGRNEGIYVVMQFTGTASVEAELRRIFQISEDQIRTMIVRLDEDAVAEAAAMEQPKPAEAAPAPALELTSATEETAAAEPTEATEATETTEEAPADAETAPEPDAIAA